MRLIYTTHDADKGRTLANFLASEGIENQLEMVKSDDWGHADYGDTVFKIWVIDEDTAETAEKWAKSFEEDPKNPQYQRSGAKTTVIPSILPHGNQDSGTGTTPPFIDLMKQRGKRASGAQTPRQEPFRSVTMSLIMLCCVFFLISLMTAPTVTSIPANLPAMPFFSAPLKKQMMYDYPRSYELTDKLIKLYGAAKLQSPETLPPEGQYIFKEIQNIPHWEGFYDQLLAHLQGAPTQPTPPLFEKIKEGEVWRLFTPALMHTDFLHILFNMLWLLILGKQLEDRLSPRRYVLLMLIIGIVSNTCQYLMSGPNFMGFSGIVCGLVAFIVVRQKIAPWEGYPLERSSSMFVVYFVMALFAIQLVSFYMEANHNTSISPGIANTAHITGAITGALLAFVPFFKKNNSIARPSK